LILDWGGGDPHPRVFLKKSPQSIENKARVLEKDRQERLRVRKRLEGKEIEEVEEVEEFRKRVLLARGAGETMVRPILTGYDRIDCRTCQYLKWVLVFRDWAQDSKA
jgi:hypothetical protein